MHVVAEFVREYRFDFVIGIVVEQGVGKDDAAGCAEAGERGIGLLAFLREMPLVDAAHARAGPFAQNNQATLEFFVFQWFKFVENRKQYHWRNLSKQHHESEEHRPRDQPPVLRGLAHQHVEQFHHYRGHDQADQKALAFVPEPGAKLLVGEVIAVLQAETVVLERSPQHFADQHQHQNIEEDGEGVVLRSAALGQIAQRSGPSGGQEHNQQSEAEREIGDAQPPLDAVVAARFWGIG